METVTRVAAVGRRLAHDVTQVLPGEAKRVYLRRGDTVRPEHLDTLADMGKEHLVVLDDGEDTAGDGRLHENDAASLLANAAAGAGAAAAQPVEGKCDVKADVDGLFLPDRAAVDETNRRLAGSAALITRAHGVPVRAGDRVAVARVFPAYLAPEAAAEAARVPACLMVRPFRRLRAGAVITGAEVAAGRVPDAFGPLLADKLSAFGSELVERRVVGDDPEAIAAALVELRQIGLDLLFATGGMAVDADDRTQAAIRAAGVEVRFAGVPMQPATLLLFGTLRGTPLFGVPAGVLYDRESALDRLLPFVLAGELPSRDQVLGMGVGGMLGGGGGHRSVAGSGTVGDGAGRDR
jgi:hypothetical protein